MEKHFKSILADALNLQGWEHLEPVVFASLASQMPMLLIGKHGAGKSMAIEKIAKILDLEFRSYNASLINYEDLTGIPIPSADYKKLNYLSSECSIWDAEAVFVDEINRTKPELQNKLFPIIYDRRIQGKKLEKLKFRWAAMNPCIAQQDMFGIDNPDEINEYEGTYPLDLSLADRFPFVVEVPKWNELSENEKCEILMRSNSFYADFEDFDNNRVEKKKEIEHIIQDIKNKYNALSTQFKQTVTNYIVSLCDILNSSFGYISSRRAVAMVETFLYLYSACCVRGLFDDAELRMTK